MSYIKRGMPVHYLKAELGSEGAMGWDPHFATSYGGSQTWLHIRILFCVTPGQQAN